MAKKAMTLRLSDEQATEVVARAEGIPVSELVRKAIDEHIAARRGDAAFRARLQERMSRDREILERLAQ